MSDNPLYDVISAAYDNARAQENRSIAAKLSSVFKQPGFWQAMLGIVGSTTPEAGRVADVFSGMISNKEFMKELPNLMAGRPPSSWWSSISPQQMALASNLASNYMANQREAAKISQAGGYQALAQRELEAANASLEHTRALTNRIRQDIRGTRRAELEKREAEEAMAGVLGVTPQTVRSYKDLGHVLPTAIRAEEIKQAGGTPEYVKAEAQKAKAEIDFRLEHLRLQNEAITKELTEGSSIFPYRLDQIKKAVELMDYETYTTPDGIVRVNKRTGDTKLLYDTRDKVDAAKFKKDVDDSWGDVGTAVVNRLVRKYNAPTAQDDVLLAYLQSKNSGTNVNPDVLAGDKSNGNSNFMADYNLMKNAFYELTTAGILPQSITPEVLEHYVANYAALVTRRGDLMSKMSPQDLLELKRQLFEETKAAYLSRMLLNLYAPKPAEVKAPQASQTTEPASKPNRWQRLQVSPFAVIESTR